MMLFLCFFWGPFLGGVSHFSGVAQLNRHGFNMKSFFWTIHEKLMMFTRNDLRKKTSSVCSRHFKPSLPPSEKKKKTEKPPLPCSVGPGKFVLNGAGFNIFSQVPLGLNLWLPRGGIGGPGIPLLRQRQWPLTAFRVVRIICNKGKEQKLVDIDKYEFCSEIAYSSQEDSEWGGISMDAQWHDVPNPADLWIN